MYSKGQKGRDGTNNCPQSLKGDSNLTVSRAGQANGPDSRLTSDTRSSFSMS